MPKVRGFQTFAVLIAGSCHGWPPAFSRALAFAQQLPRLAGPPAQDNQQNQGRAGPVRQHVEGNVNVVQLFFNVKTKRAG